MKEETKCSTCKNWEKRYMNNGKKETPCNNCIMGVKPEYRENIHVKAKFSDNYIIDFTTEQILEELKKRGFEVHYYDPNSLNDAREFIYEFNGTDLIFISTIKESGESKQ